MSVDYYVPDGAYSLVLDEPSGAQRSLGAITVAGGRGDWTGSAKLSKGETVTVSMVSDAGVVVCKASLPSATVT